MDFVSALFSAEEDAGWRRRRRLRRRLRRRQRRSVPVAGVLVVARRLVTVTAPLGATRFVQGARLLIRSHTSTFSTRATMSSDPRFARLKTDPRFRKPKKQQSKVAVDDRFKSVFEDDKKKGKKGKAGSCYDLLERAGVA